MNVATLLLLAASLALASGARADDSAAAPAKPPAPAPAKPLDLRPPEITKLYTSRQLAELLDKIEQDNIEEVEVEGEREHRPVFTPRVWPGIGAPFWALFHPTQAWRIFAPIPPDQARYIGTKPAPYTDAGYLEPAGVPPGPFDH
ncbi:MAG TPA: hypothetical protein VH814_14955 [Steroidobacteraceae bacterium]|jgi:hypothetical protein